MQDAGRWGYQHLGINPGGAMDRFSASLANALLGKALNAPVMELHFPASTFLFGDACIVCLTGADFTPVVNDVSVSMNQPLFIRANSVLQFNGLKSGARCYLTFLNEWRLPKWLNSYSTNLKAAAGGYKGRRLMKGDEAEFEPLLFSRMSDDAAVALPWRYKEQQATTGEIEFIVGNEWKWLDTKSQTVFLNEPFTITSSSDRMGYRLQGEPLQQKEAESLVSSAVGFGTIQLLPNGQLIILMADHQTTGGYPRMGHVISAHLPTLAQMKPGDKLKFVMTTIEEAQGKAATQQNVLSAVQTACKAKIQNWLNAH